MEVEAIDCTEDDIDNQSQDGAGNDALGSSLDSIHDMSFRSDVFLLQSKAMFASVLLCHSNLEDEGDMSLSSRVVCVELPARR